METLLDQIIEMQKEIDFLKEKQANERDVEKHNELSDLIYEKEEIMWALKMQRFRKILS